MATPIAKQIQQEQFKSNTIFAPATTLTAAEAIKPKASFLKSNSIQFEELVKNGFGVLDIDRDVGYKEQGTDRKDFSKSKQWTTGRAPSYLMTPKYAPSHSEQNRMARFYIPASLFESIKAKFPDVAEDEVFAALHDTSANGGYFKFLLQNVQEAYSENVQVVQTLSDNFVVFSTGAKPQIFSYSGTLINTQEDDWRTGFFWLYYRYLRASQMAKFGNNDVNIRNYSLIKYDNIYVRGIMLNMNMGMNSSNELAVPFSFSYLVQDVFLIKQVKSAGFDTGIVDRGTEQAVLAKNMKRFTNKANAAYAGGKPSAITSNKGYAESMKPLITSGTS